MLKKELRMQKNHQFQNENNTFENNFPKLERTNSERFGPKNRISFARSGAPSPDPERSEQHEFSPQFKQFQVLEDFGMKNYQNTIILNNCLSLFNFWYKG